MPASRSVQAIDLVMSRSAPGMYSMPTAPTGAPSSSTGAATSVRPWAGTSRYVAGHAVGRTRHDNRTPALHRPPQVRPHAGALPP